MRKTLLAAALALAAGPLAGCADTSRAEAPSTAAMQPGQRMQLASNMGQRTVREVMVSQGGGGITVVYDMPPGAPQSQRVVRLENVNGMLEVVYDTSMGNSMPLASGGTPRLVQRGGGMYNVEYDRR